MYCFGKLSVCIIAKLVLALACLSFLTFCVRVLYKQLCLQYECAFLKLIFFFFGIWVKLPAVKRGSWPAGVVNSV